MNAPVICWCAALVSLVSTVDLIGQEPNPSPYRVPPIALPRLVRPPTDVDQKLLPRGTVGTKPPAFDGDRLLVNLRAAAPQVPADNDVTATIRQIARAVGWRRDTAELVLVQRSVPAGPDTSRIKGEIERGREETRRRASAKVGPLSPSTERAIRESAESVSAAAQRRGTIWAFDQRVGGVPIDNSGLLARWIEGRGLSSVRGRVFNQVNIENKRRLSPAEAQTAARRHIARFEPVGEQQQKVAPTLVLVPYKSAFRYAWRFPIEGESGTYLVWVDADSGEILQLLPQFFFEDARGLTFVPSPSGTTDEKEFEIDNVPSGGRFLLKLSSVLDVTNDGADGVSSGDLTVTSSNYNTSPLNGTTVNRTNLTGYNSRFQDINAYAWVSSDLKWGKLVGAQPLSAILLKVNTTSTGCSGGANQACASGSTIGLGIGTATTGTSTSTNDLFNSALDATVITHEWGHFLSGKQFSVGGGLLAGSVNEGLSDFWASHLHNTDTFGAYWNQNRTTPVQSGGVPRQAEALDVFPEHRAGNVEVHADGQMIHWALWRTRVDFTNRSALGALSLGLNLIRSLTTSGVGVGAAMDDNTVHDAFQDVFQELLTEIGTTTTAHSALVGFARAGLVLSDRDAVIDINDPYLARTGPAPTFTVWTGRDFTFSPTTGASSASTGFNNRFRVQVANDAAFSVNSRTSPQRTAAVTGRVPQGSWTLPAADWATLKTGDRIFYRVTTTDASGGNVRTSENPGNGFITALPAASAAINESGQCECGCSSAGAQTSRSERTIPGARLPLATLLPLAVAGLWWLMARTRRT